LKPIPSSTVTRTGIEKIEEEGITTEVNDLMVGARGFGLRPGVFADGRIRNATFSS
jgi:hypothetical protein